MSPLSALHRQGGRRRQRGLALVEFTLVAPVLLLFLLGLAELGRAFNQYDTLTKAVRDAARHYAVGTYQGNSLVPDPARAAEAANMVCYGSPAGGRAPLLPGPLPAVSATIDAGGDYVTVSASYPFAFLAGNPLAAMLRLFGRSLPSALVLRATETMRIL
jgi:Flp pilus assembly protein TadG